MGCQGGAGEKLLLTGCILSIGLARTVTAKVKSIAEFLAIQRQSAGILVFYDRHQISNNSGITINSAGLIAY
jgi:hypothetical protein